MAIVRVSGARGARRSPGALLGALPRAARCDHAQQFRDRRRRRDRRGLALYFPAPHSYTGEHVLELQGHGGAVLVEALIAPCARTRRTPGAARGIHAARVFERQARSGAGRGGRRSDRCGFRSGGARGSCARSKGEFSAPRAARCAQALASCARRSRPRSISPTSRSSVLRPRACASRLRGAVTAAARAAGGEPPGAAADRRHDRRDRRADPMPANPPCSTAWRATRRRSSRDAAGHHARRAARAHPARWHAAASAGHRGTARQAGDAIEAEGIRRAEAAMSRADRILFVIDAAVDPQAIAYQAARPRLPAGVPVTVVFNKIDLAAHAAPSTGRGVAPAQCRAPARAWSRCAPISRPAWVSRWAPWVPLSARARHVEALTRCAQHLDGALRAHRAAGRTRARSRRVAARRIGAGRAARYRGPPMNYWAGSLAPSASANERLLTH